MKLIKSLWSNTLGSDVHCPLWAYLLISALSATMYFGVGYSLGRTMKESEDTKKSIEESTEAMKKGKYISVPKED